MAKRISPAVIYVLKGLMPYSRENLLLSFKPNRFFNEMERISGYSQPTLQKAYYRAKKTQLISDGSTPKLTFLGQQKLQPFIAKALNNRGVLMVIFDIPESLAFIRRQFRGVLRELRFKPVQQSVWITNLDQLASIRQAIQEMNLEDYVQVYESARLYPTPK